MNPLSLFPIISEFAGSSWQSFFAEYYCLIGVDGMNPMDRPYLWFQWASYYHTGLDLTLTLFLCVSILSGIKGVLCSRLTGLYQSVIAT